MQDLRVFNAWTRGEPVGAILLSRLTFEGDRHSVFVLGPVAVVTDQRNQGIGQRLIYHGIEVIRQEGADLEVTYGATGSYRRVGFKLISQDDEPAPFFFQHPEVWSGPPPNNAPMSPLKGPSRRVRPFIDPAFW